MSEYDPVSIDAFIQRWAASGAAERANYQLFLSELCDVLAVARPDPQVADDAANAYVFEKPVPLPHGTTGRIDLYKRGCFVLEAKQGSDRLPPPPPNPDRQGGAANIRRRGTATRGTATWDTAMERAREQAQSYARNLPPAELSAAGSGGGRPPFLIVVDVGATIELYSEFTRTGGAYLAFPDPQHHRLTLEELRDPDVRALLATVWTDPLSLDPAQRSARVTRTIAGQLAALARSLEASHPADDVAHFLMRCLFTMFAEDVGLLPNRSFTQLLADLRHDVASFPPMIEHLWRTMDAGGFSVILRTQIPRFNGELFAASTALPLDAGQLQLLSEAARADWRDVEPAIFGTLLERALNPIERHKLGAHYTPRAYVERLVQPTVVEPLRQEWDSVKTAALLLQEQGQTHLAAGVVEDFLRKLAHTRVLDPACGTANFLYVTMEHLKRLEAEVLHLLRELGEAQLTLELEGVQVTPQQFLGIELNPRAAAIAELVLWIGFLQWHYRTRGDVQPAEPIVRAFHNIECRDAVLAWDGVEAERDAAGQPVTRWDGRTLKRHPVTGEEVPDETARVPVLRYINPRPAPWPQADFIVGNPPFIGNKRMRFALGDGYTDALRATYRNAVPESADYVMYWWHKAAGLVRNGEVRRFGLITTNSITQVYNAGLVGKELSGKPLLSLVFAIPDHPWVDSAEGAAVRIAMTVVEQGEHPGTLLKVSSEIEHDEDAVAVEFVAKRGMIHADLSVGADTGAALLLSANQSLSTQGVTPLGLGFRLLPDQLTKLGIDKENLPAVVKPYLIGRDIVRRFEEKYIIDFYGLSEIEAREQHPELYQIVYESVKPERDAKAGRNADADQYAREWWLFAKTRSTFRPALVGIDRYIATCRTAKHRIFTFVPANTLPDAKIVAIALDDAYFLGVLSSRIHVVWSLRTGGWLGVGNDSNYNHSDCFGKFPFPAATEAQQARIRALAEQIDAHRKRQQARHPALTLTDIYNVLARLRALAPNLDRQGGELAAIPPNPDREGGELAAIPPNPDREGGELAAIPPNPDREGGSSSLTLAARMETPPLATRPSPLTTKERAIHDQGLVAVLQQLHDELDAAVADAYGWPAYLPNDAILQRLAELNARRAAEEASGLIRWLRPGYQQARAGVEPVQAALVEEEAEAGAAPLVVAAALPWPASMPEQARAVRGLLQQAAAPLTPAEVAARFVKADKARVAELLATLASLGQAGEAAGRYGAV
jgi:hypothetical protein